MSELNDLSDEFDEYCREKGIQQGEEAAAFAAFLHERTGWDGKVVPICTCEAGRNCAVHGTTNDEVTE